MTYTPSPDEYPTNRQATWPDTPTERVYPDTPTERVRDRERVYEGPVAPENELVMERASTYRRRAAARRVGQIIYILFGVLEALLIIRFALKLLGANPGAAFTSFIYGLTQVFVAPFEGVFPSPATNASVLEVSTLLAIIVYALIAWLIVSVIDALTNRWPGRVA